MEHEAKPLNMLVVGAGGIGSQVLELLTAALRRVNLTGTITVMDGDIVEASTWATNATRQATSVAPKSRAWRNAWTT